MKKLMQKKVHNSVWRIVTLFTVAFAAGVAFMVIFGELMAEAATFA